VTTKPKAKTDEDTAEEPASTEEAQVEVETPRCGAPHSLPILAPTITCTLPAQDPDRAPGTPDHEHRHEDGDTIYVW
jgi:hypothetical protein